MTTYLGADSAEPQPDLYRGHDIWAVYVGGATPHIWTHEEVAALGDEGVRAVLPIVVPGQSRQWWLGDAGAAELRALAQLARTWGVPAGSPLCLDIEEGQAEQLHDYLPSVAVEWVNAASALRFLPWSYGGTLWHSATAGLHRRWLAEWPDTVPADPEPPPGFMGWQYQGNAEGGRIDRDVFRAGVYLSPRLEVITMTDDATQTPEPAPEPVTVPETAEDIAAAEAPASEGAGPVDIPAEASVAALLAALRMYVTALDSTLAEIESRHL